MTPLPDKLRYLHETVNTTDTEIEEMIAFVEVDGVGVALFKNSAGVKLTVSGSKEYIHEFPLLTSRDTYWKERVQNMVIEHVGDSAKTVDQVLRLFTNEDNLK